MAVTNPAEVTLPELAAAAAALGERPTYDTATHRVHAAGVWAATPPGTRLDMSLLGMAAVQEARIHATMRPAGPSVTLPDHLLYPDPTEAQREAYLARHPYLTTQ